MTKEAQEMYLKGGTIKVVFSPTGIIMSVNDNFKSIMGFDGAELEGRHVSILRHRFIPEEFYLRAFDDITGSCILQELMVCETKCGRITWTKGPVYPIFDEDSDIVGYCSRKLVCSPLEIEQAIELLSSKFGVEKSLLKEYSDE